MPYAGTFELTQASYRTRSFDDLKRFYSDIVGLAIAESENLLSVSPAGSTTPFLLFGLAPDLPRRDPHAPGLFHLALLFPSRAALGSGLARIMRTEYPIDGFADHGVSEAIYLRDPDGNGLELYRDREESEWPRDERGISMVTEPLDYNALIEEAGERNFPAAQVRIGHVHLQTGSLPAAEHFYHTTFGLDVTQRTYPGALFLSANGYHHHLGLNIWRSRNIKPPQDPTLGFFAYSARLDSKAVAADKAERFRTSGYAIVESVESSGPDSFTIRDPNNIQLRLTW